MDWVVVEEAHAGARSWSGEGMLFAGTATTVGASDADEEEVVDDSEKTALVVSDGTSFLTVCASVCDDDEHDDEGGGEGMRDLGAA